jgi:hypothetical protein
MLEFMMRVKLPNSSNYACCPSGDTEYESDRHEALKKATPEGFEIIEERTGVNNPRDSAGFTYVRVRPKLKEKTALNDLISACQDALNEFERLNEVGVCQGSKYISLRKLLNEAIIKGGTLKGKE